MSGPVPKRSTERRRRNKVPGLENVAPVIPGTVTIPPLHETAHPIARDWYESLKTSGQSQLYEPSDWASAIYVAEAMTRNLESSRFSGQLFAAVMSAMGELLTTEGSRRRVRLEIERRAGEQDATDRPDNVTDYRSRLRS